MKRKSKINFDMYQKHFHFFIFFSNQPIYGNLHMIAFNDLSSSVLGMAVLPTLRFKQSWWSLWNNALETKTLKQSSWNKTLVIKPLKQRPQINYLLSIKTSGFILRELSSPLCVLRKYILFFLFSNLNFLWAISMP